VSSSASYKFKIELNLDTKISVVNINGSDCGIFDITNNFAQISKLVIGTTDAAILTVTPTRVSLYSNYLVNENFNGFNRRNTIRLENNRNHVDADWRWSRQF